MRVAAPNEVRSSRKGTLIHIYDVMMLGRRGQNLGRPIQAMAFSSPWHAFEWVISAVDRRGCDPFIVSGDLAALQK